MEKMLDAKDIVVWVNDETKEVLVRTHAWASRRIGAIGAIQSERPIRNGPR
jgi:hypothetical protein